MNLNLKVLIPTAVVTLGLLILGLNSYKVVEPGEVGVSVFMGNTADKPLQSGFHMLNPMTAVTDIDVRNQIAEVEANSSTEDVQQVVLKVSITNRPEISAVPSLYQQFGTSRAQWKSRIIKPAVLEIIKGVTSQFPANDLITRRPEVSKMLSSQIKEKLLGNNIHVSDVAITNIQFSPKYMQVVEAKQMAEEQAKAEIHQLQRAKTASQKLVATAEAQAEAAILTAEAAAKVKILEGQAEADYQNKIASSLTEKGLRLLWLKSWNGILPSTVAGEDSSMLLNISN
jgi:regulator of protease activity HflC (stomatin/prohibitin superfamily)